MAKSAALSALSDSSIWLIRLCIKDVKLVDAAPAEPAELFSLIERASSLASFLARATASSFKSSNSLIASIICDKDSAA
jgi:hypothetical protein